MYITIKYKGNYFNDIKVRKAIEDNLISMKAYKKENNKFYYELPKIKINKRIFQNGTKEKEIGKYIEIDLLKDVRIREKIEARLDVWDTALPSNYVCSDVPRFSDDGNKLFIEYENLSEYKQEKYSVAEFKMIIDNLNKTELYFDKKHVIDLNNYPHWIFCGSTGSGKTTLNEMIITECLMKGIEVKLGDVHKSLNIYSDYVKYYTSASEILEMLKDIEAEMRSRLDEIGKIKERGITSLKLNRIPIVVFIEEYIDTRRLLSKEELKEFDNLITQISVSARKTGIFLFISSQAISTSIMSTDDKQQFSKIYLGNGDKNEYVKTFGEGIKVPIRSFENKGEGFISVNNKVTIIRCPYITDLDIESLNNLKQ